MVGKALNDPLKDSPRLSRIGVQFTAKQQEQIKAMVEVGDASRAQKIILRELDPAGRRLPPRRPTASTKACQVAWGNLEGSHR